MAEYFGTTVEDIFQTQTKRFRPEGAEGVNAVVAYDIAGEGGGCWKLTIQDGTAKTVKVESGSLEPYTAKLASDAETFVGVQVGKIDGMEAFSSNKIRVDGDIGLIIALPKMFTKYVPPRKGVTAADIVATMPERFRADRAKDLNVKIGYDLAGEGGGQWTAIIKNGTLEMVEGLAADRTVDNIVSAKDYVDLMTGKLDPMVAMGSGRLRLTGDMEVAQLLPKIFAKFVPKDAEAGPELIVLKKTISVNMRYPTGPVMGRFFEGLRERKIVANQCPKCKRKQLPPREVCAVCQCRVHEFVEVGPGGLVTQLDVAFYASPDPLTGETRETPYGALNVLLDGCQGLMTFWHMLKKEDLLETKPGDRVRPVWSEKPVGSVHDILYFEKVR